MSMDGNRAWFDQRSFGVLSNHFPIQSTIACSISSPVSHESASKLDDIFVKFAKKSSLASENVKIHFNEKETNLVGKICSSVLKGNSLLVFENQHQRENIRTLRSCMDWLSDLAILTEIDDPDTNVTTRNDLQNKNDREVSTKGNQTDEFKYQTNMNNSNTSKLPIQNNESFQVISDSKPLVRKPFKSALDQFKQEGGVIKKAKPDDDFNNETKGVKRPVNCKKDAKSDLPAELQHCEPELVARIESDIIQHGQAVTFAEIAGLDFAKKCVQEVICWPMLRPDIFSGLRALPRGLLLFGPPGTGKTLIGKAIAHQAGATFFCISASSLTSKWIGEGEKSVKTLFAVAVYRQPSVIFIDEVDSLLCQRSTEENEASRRIKTEFLVQLDGAGTDQNARVVVVGATNRPEELDEAARRRFVKRIYIPLPDASGRRDMVARLLASSQSPHNLRPGDIDRIVDKTAGFSGADVRSLCTEAAMGPIREIATNFGSLTTLRAEDVPPISCHHFEEALDVVAPSVSASDLVKYVEWNSIYGSYRRME